MTTIDPYVSDAITSPTGRLVFFLVIIALAAWIFWLLRDEITGTLQDDCPDCDRAGEVFDPHANMVIVCDTCDGRGWLPRSRHDLGTVSKSWRESQLSGRDHTDARR